MDHVIKISKCQFGKIIIDNHTYTNDVIIYNKKVYSPWQRKEGHQVNLEDFPQMSLEAFTDLIIGTGYYGQMIINPVVEAYCRIHKINLHVLHTPKAVELFNGKTGEEKHLLSAFHLTC